MTASRKASIAKVLCAHLNLTLAILVEFHLVIRVRGWCKEPHSKSLQCQTCSRLQPRSLLHPRTVRYRSSPGVPDTSPWPRLQPPPRAMSQVIAAAAANNPSTFVQVHQKCDILTSLFTAKHQCGLQLHIISTRANPDSIEQQQTN